MSTGFSFLTGILEFVTESAKDNLTGMPVKPVAVDPFGSEGVKLSIGKAVEVEVKPGEAVTVEVDGEAADVDVAVSEEAVTVEVASEIADVGVAVSEEGVAVDAARVAVEVSDGISVGVGDVVEVQADSTGLPEVGIFGLDVTELADHSAIGTLAFF